MFTSKSRKKFHKAGHSCELMSSYDVVPLVGFKTTRVQKVHSRILLYLSYSGCSRKADSGTIAIGLVCRVSYRESEGRRGVQKFVFFDIPQNRCFSEFCQKSLILGIVQNRQNLGFCQKTQKTRKMAKNGHRPISQ